MKNYKLILAIAVVFAVGSAFTGKNKALSGEYILVGNTYVLVEHACEVSPGDICDFTKTGSATTPMYPDQYKNPANFTPNRINARVVEQ